MLGIDMRRAEVEGARLDIALDVAAHDVIHLAVGIMLVGTYVDHHTALVGYHVVLGARVYHRHLHRGGS